MGRAAKGSLLDRTGKHSARRDIEIEGMGGTVTLRSLSVREKLDLERNMGEVDRENPNAILDVLYHAIAVVICAEDGAPMFTEEELPDAVAGLYAKPQEAVQALVDLFMGMNGVQSAEASEAQIEADVGNSDASPTDSSSSDSQPNSDTPALNP